MAESTAPNYESGECSQCGSEYTDLRKHWSLSSSCSTPEGRGTYATVKCAHCGKEHQKERYELQENEHSYCSPECRNEGIRTGKRVECAWCGDEVYKPDCHLHDMGGYGLDNHFCDKDCEQEWKRSNWTLQNHPNWRGGKGGIDAVRKALSENSWRDTARRVREQSDGQCEICGSEGEGRGLDVHHIIPVAAGGTNGDYNLMVLCIACHRKAESYTRQFTTPHLYELGE